MVIDPTTPSLSDTDLRRYRYYTGAEPTRLLNDEPCPPLFRDLGLEAMLRFMRRELVRLCGPVSPITYMRSAGYVEPYTDYGQTGRVLLLAPQTVVPWHSGIDTVFIGPREIRVDYESMIFIPSEIPLPRAAALLSDAQTIHEASEVLGRTYYAEATRATIARLEHLQRTHQASERLAAPLRRRFQSSDCRERDVARQWMSRTGLTESDLCTAWNHLSDERREFIGLALVEVEKAILQC